MNVFFFYAVVFLYIDEPGQRNLSQCEHPASNAWYQQTRVRLLTTVSFTRLTQEFARTSTR